MSIEKSCVEVVNKITEGNAVIFCGAGISYNSGLPIVSTLLDYLFTKMDLPGNEKELITKSDLPFESIMEKVLNESGLDKIMEIFGGGIPNCNHTFIAKLAKKGYINTIYTTNFDRLIEKALEFEGFIANKDYNVYSSEKELNDLNWNSSTINIIKIHGCVSKKKDMVITMSMIASDRYSEMRRNIMNTIFSGSKYDSVIVLGYSCSDLDLTPLIESVEGKKKVNIQFIDHLPSAGDGSGHSRSEQVSVKKDKNPFKRYEGTRHFINTDELVKAMWIQLLETKFYTSPILVSNWKQNIDEWYINSVSESGKGVKHHIASRLLYSIGEFNKAIEHHKKAIAIALGDKNIIAYAAEKGNLGMVLSKIGEYKQAELCLNESILLCQREGFTKNLASQLQALGTLLHRTGRDDEAILAHKKALTYAEMEQDENSISTILGDMSNSYNKIGLFDLSKKALEKALVLSRKLGNKQAESSQLGIISYAHFFQGNVTLAIDCCLKGIEIKRSIADKYGECELMLVLVSFYYNSGHLLEAKEVAGKCKALAREIGNEKAEISVGFLEQCFGF